eukprot:20189-Chlamydomonas_euryale.AAC.2
MGAPVAEGEYTDEQLQHIERAAQQAARRHGRQCHAGCIGSPRIPCAAKGCCVMGTRAIAGEHRKCPC